MIRIVIAGAAGRMGRILLGLVLEADDLELSGAVEAADHPALGTDAGVLAGAGGTSGVVLATALPAEADVAIDFSLPEGSLALVEACAARGLPVVVGTTGFTPEQRAQLAAAGQKAPVLLSPNMSVGVNVLFRAAADLARALGPEYDVEIVEAHHRYKKDAPSGTALALGEAVAEATGRDLETAGRYGRGRGPAPRTGGEIGVHAVRGGDIVGEHTVLYAGCGERIELRHVAHSRETFARGALRAARWLADRGPGLYSMQDVLAL